MVGITYVYIEAVIEFYGYLFSTHLYCLVGCLSMIVWMFANDCLDTCWCLICMCFVFFYLHLFSAIEHVSHGKALLKYAHYYYHYHYVKQTKVNGDRKHYCHHHLLSARHNVVI